MTESPPSTELRTRDHLSYFLGGVDQATHVFRELRAALPPEQAEAIEAILLGPFYDGPHKASGAATQSIPPQPPAPHRYGYGDDYDSDVVDRPDLLLGYDHMDWPVTRLFGADDDPAAEARREERVRAVWADLDRQSEDRAREFRARQAAERQRSAPQTPPPDGLLTPAEAAAKPAKPRKPRRPSISKMIAQAEKATGKPVTAITLPDGTKLDFEREQSSQGNEVDQWIAKHADKTQRH